MLGAVESGVDFERRIADIYQRCRHPNDIHAAFQQLQLDLAGQINDAMVSARKSLLENFDEEVQARLKVAQTDAKASLDRLERMLMRFTLGMLDGHAQFESDDLTFTLKSLPEFLNPHFLGENSCVHSPMQSPSDAILGRSGFNPTSCIVGINSDLQSNSLRDKAGFDWESFDPATIPLGRYELPRRSDEAHVYRLQHPLAQSLLKAAQAAPCAPAKLHLDYDAYGAQVSALKEFRGREGVAAVLLLRVESLGASEEYLLAAALCDDNVLDAEFTEKLLQLPGTAEPFPRAEYKAADAVQESPQAGLDFAAAHVVMPAQVRIELERQKAQILGTIETRNLQLFTDETDKLDAWADDQKVSLEREIKELDRRIKETRTKSKGAATLAEKLAAQKDQRDLETQRDRKRRDLFARQDEIQARRDEMIDKLEGQLQQQVHLLSVMACQWRMQ